jgi:hypothetical protein
MCTLTVEGHDLPRRKYICVSPIFRQLGFKGLGKFSGNLQFNNLLLRNRHESIVDWMNLVEDAFDIKVGNRGWVIDNWPENKLHFAVLLVRQTVELAPFEGDPDKAKIAVNPLREIQEDCDPLVKFLRLTDQGKFKWSLGHGLGGMVLSMKARGIPFEAVTLKQAILDLEKSPYGINSSWDMGNLIGTGE